MITSLSLSLSHSYFTSLTGKKRVVFLIDRPFYWIIFFNLSTLPPLHPRLMDGKPSPNSTIAPAVRARCLRGVSLYTEWFFLSRSSDYLANDLENNCRPFLKRYPYTSCTLNKCTNVWFSNGNLHFV